MADADQAKLVGTLTAAASMVAEGQVHRLTDGHTFAVADADQAAARLQGLLDNAVALQTRAAAVVAGQESVNPVEFVRQCSGTLAELDVAGANPNPMFTGMMALNTLGELGLSPDAGPASSWRRPPLITPTAPSLPRRAVAGVGLIAGVIGWRIRGRNR